MFGFSYAALALPILLAGAYIYAFGVNVVFVDAWEVVPYFERLSQGSLTVRDLWEQHNQNRSVFPRMTMLALGTATQWNTIAEMYVVLGSLSAAMLCMFVVFVKEQRGRLLAPLAFLPAAFVLLSLRQSWNFLSGYQITFAFAQAFSIFALCLLYAGSRSPSRAMAFALPVAVACAVIATFSAFQGLAVWAAGALLLIFTRERGGRFVASWSGSHRLSWSSGCTSSISPPTRTHLRSFIR